MNGNEPSERNAQRLRDDPEGYSNYRNWYNSLAKQVKSKEVDGTEFPSFRLLDRALFAMGEYVGHSVFSIRKTETQNSIHSA